MIVPGVSIRTKLALLAGIPVLGALVLAMQIVASARDQARKAESLGSVEGLVDLSTRMARVLHSLQRERAEVAMESGLRARLARRGGSPMPVAGPGSESDQRAATAQLGRDLDTLDQFLIARDLSKLPSRLSTALEQARSGLRTLPEYRKTVVQGGYGPKDTLDSYDVAARDLVRATAALTDLSDDGQFLRLVTTLVALLSLEERASEEHSLLAHVFARGQFPPGSYKRLVTIVSEQDTHTQVFETLASVEKQKEFEALVSGDVPNEALAMRKTALYNTDETLDVDAALWFSAQQRKVSHLVRIEEGLEREIHATVLDKLARTRRSVLLSIGLAVGVIVSSLVFAWLLALGITRRVRHLLEASKRIGQGDLALRVDVGGGDELGKLGGAFNDMVGELSRARLLLSDQVRMAKELEIAATIQRAMLPPAPCHPDFEFAGKMRPATEVGGDFYDVLARPGTPSLWITVGDVSGHGVGAGLVMLMTEAAIASHFLLDPSLPPERVLSDVNALLRENIVQRLRDDKYVTGQLLTYAGDGRFVCVGAHVWPLVFRSATGKCEVVCTPGPWLGIVPELSDVPRVEINLHPGDVLCLYSDGVTEARNELGELFDVHRLAEAVEGLVPTVPSLDGVVERVFSSVETFSGQHEDDWTMLLVRRLAIGTTSAPCRSS